MIRLALTLAAALACIAAAPAKKPPAKAAPKPAAAQAAKPAAAGGYDAQNPQSLVDLLNTAGAKAELGKREADSVLVTATSTAADFSVQFAGCDAHARGCRGALYDSLASGSATLQQINSFNQASLNCRIYQDKGGQPHIVYSQLLMKSDTRDSALTHLAAWQGCLADGRTFLRDPVTYLANAA
jgi:hypothetical protein